MEQVLFASDLDNTLLFSYKHRRDTDQCVERLEGKEQGFCTQKSLELLARVRKETLFIPVTTRSVAQYRRICWPADCLPRYAVAANGGILLADGQIDPGWREETERLAAPWREELEALERRLPEVSVPKRFRMVDGIYLFAACDNREDAETVGRFFAGQTALDTAVSGRKVYFFPPPINKGEAVCRLQKRFCPDWTVCAGDSIIDIPMLRIADLAVVPDGELLPEGSANAVVLPSNGIRFPDFVLETVLQKIKG